MLKIQEWSVNRRIESLRQMDKMLSEMNVGSRYTIWQSYGGGLKATADETQLNWQHIAEDDEAYEENAGRQEGRLWRPQASVYALIIYI